MCHTGIVKYCSANISLVISNALFLLPRLTSYRRNVYIEPINQSEKIEIKKTTSFSSLSTILT